MPSPGQHSSPAVPLQVPPIPLSFFVFATLPGMTLTVVKPHYPPALCRLLTAEHHKEKSGSHDGWTYFMLMGTQNLQPLR